MPLQDILSCGIARHPIGCLYVCSYRFLLQQVCQHDTARICCWTPCCGLQRRCSMASSVQFPHYVSAVHLQSRHYRLLLPYKYSNSFSLINCYCNSTMYTANKLKLADFIALHCSRRPLTCSVYSINWTLFSFNLLTVTREHNYTSSKLTESCK